MVTNCWTGSGVEGFVKALKFVELSAINMFAITNLAICVNLALVISVSIPSPLESLRVRPLNTRNLQKYKNSASFSITLDSLSSLLYVHKPIRSSPRTYDAHKQSDCHHGHTQIRLERSGCFNLYR